MSREKKVQIVDQLHEMLSKCSVGVLTDYRGLSAAAMTDLRRKLREAGIEYRVVKNTLARFAAERSGRDELVDLFEGPVAIAFGYGEITEPAKVLADYIQASKEILLAQVLGGIQSPIVYLVGALISPIRGIMGVLQARITQLEGE